MGLFAKKSTVGLDFGHHSIKAMQLEKTAEGWKVIKIASAPTPREAMKDGVIVDASLMSLVLKQLLRENHIGATTAHIAVSGGSVVVRPVKIPLMAEAALRKSIKLEAGRYVPSSAEDSFVEFEILGEAEEGQMDVLVVAAPKDIVETRLEVCEAAGLEVESVDIEAFAIYRSIVEADPARDWSDKTIAVIDIGATTTNVSVVPNGSFAMSRTIPNGGQMLTEALKNYFKLSEEDAESGKSQLDFRELTNEVVPRENPPLRVLQPHVDDLVREIRRSLNYYQSQQQDAKKGSVDALLLTGGGAKLMGLSEYMGHKLGIETLSLDVFQNPRFLHSMEESGLDLSVVSGLAMRAFGRAA
ncbi:MAG TPA: type IV pilus assembly protein PilM [Fimbriimonadaceae bacterium]|nr:type IV pilus assembly protein PilM [Fimbriimonadaceae bacterium]